MKISCVTLKVCFELSKAKGKHYLCSEKQIDNLLKLSGAIEHSRQINGEFIVFEVDSDDYSSEWLILKQDEILNTL